MFRIDNKSWHDGFSIVSKSWLYLSFYFKWFLIIAFDNKIIWVSQWNRNREEPLKFDAWQPWWDFLCGPSFAGFYIDAAIFCWRIFQLKNFCNLFHIFWHVEMMWSDVFVAQGKQWNISLLSDLWMNYYNQSLNFIRMGKTKMKNLPLKKKIMFLEKISRIMM